MPIFTAETETGRTASGFGYSATSIDALGATEYTLVSLVVDRSGSVAGFKPELEKAIREVVAGCQMSPRADYIMLRLTTFANDTTETHGFIPVSQLDLSQYDGCLDPLQGMTSLFQATQEGVEAMTSYGQNLVAKDFAVNGVLVVITDGDDNRGGQRWTAITAGAAISGAISGERLESLLSILIGVGATPGASLSQYLSRFQSEAGFAQFVAAPDVSAKGTAKLAGFISRSVSAQSQHLGTGGPSQPLTF